ncbi:RNA polymerase sigma factor [Flagellimonas marinaquae]|uniref:RNA polymerase sigma factor n=1 Tax=Flagellimonas marinaquae TaxID=254955 RepID=UPI002074FBBC|nr:RNA polymerase sigma factor [Allomuricauda aquimarina]USD25865.1 RNA polymerase sigma factor [Allomuricauda aquimarina]
MDASIQFTHKDLVEGSKQGDGNSQKQLFNLYVDAMYNTAYRMMGNKEDAEDIVQEGFMDAFRYLSSFKYESSFGAWLKRIVINKCINRLKVNKIEWEPFTANTYQYAQEEPYVDDVPDVNKVMIGIGMLPIGYKQIISLYLIEGYDHQEISEILGVAISTSKSQYHRAKKKLIKILKEL